MIGTSLPEYVFIRVCIFVLRFLPAFEAAGLVACAAARWRSPRLVWPVVGGWILVTLLVLEAVYAVRVWRPFRHRKLRVVAEHPPQRGGSEARRKLFEKCFATVPDQEAYLRGWFLGAELEDIRRENVREFLLWAFFDRDGRYEGSVANGFGRRREVLGGSYDGELGGAIDGEEDVEAELEGYVDEVERRLGQPILPGRGKAMSLRLTFDDIETKYRSVLWFAVVGLVDTATHIQLSYHGFHYHAEPIGRALSVFPPRPLQVVAAHRSPVDDLAYWYRPHTSKRHLPIVFLHGIGVGLWTYTRFLAEINDRVSRNRGDQDGGDGGQIGILAIEILPISFRIGDVPLDKDAFLSRVERILAHHQGWDNFVLVAHSYGSVLTTHLLRSERFAPRIPAVVLIDPVSILLHLPDVAYNFTRRKPKRANEWQLWYFASMDPGVARCLGRHFFWRDNEVWKEELLGCIAETGNEEGEGYMRGVQGVDEVGVVGGNSGFEGEGCHGSGVRERDAGRWKSGLTKRKVTVSLSGRDIIVDTATVARYLLGGESGRFAGRVEEGRGRRPSGRFADLSVDPNSAPAELGDVAQDIQVLWFPLLDHAGVFDSPADREQVVHAVRSSCEI